MIKASKGAVTFAAMTIVGIVGPAAAGEGHDHDHREHGAHVHGVASLNVAVDGDKLLIELDSPAANLVGFEHAPRDDAQREAVDNVKAQLADGASLFVPDAQAGCALESYGLDMALAEHGDDGHAHDAGDDHDGDHAHAHAEDEAHEEHAHDADVHSDVHAEYTFTCAAPQALKTLDVRLFDAFPGTERLRVQSITPSGQSAGELTPANHALAL